MAVKHITKIVWECDSCKQTSEENSIPDEWIWLCLTQESNPGDAKTYNMYQFLICRECNYKMSDVLKIDVKAVWKFFKDQ